MIGTSTISFGTTSLLAAIIIRARTATTFWNTIGLIFSTLLLVQFSTAFGLILLFDLFGACLDHGKRRQFGHGSTPTKDFGNQVTHLTVTDARIGHGSVRCDQTIFIFWIKRSRHLFKYNESMTPLFQFRHEFFHIVHVQDGGINRRKGNLWLFNQQFLNGLFGSTIDSLGTLHQNGAVGLIQTLGAQVLRRFQLGSTWFEHILQYLVQHFTGLEVFAGNLLGFTNKTGHKDGWSLVKIELESFGNGLFRIRKDMIAIQQTKVRR
mmetsp:Transcript_6498/g.10757  ORF Transcript_6498/g.10757 Transcript_6498/m.10757 type:complete len:265 (-) Transcript_6498:458-1252(-)